jgi:hypothetical protein
MKNLDLIQSVFYLIALGTTLSAGYLGSLIGAAIGVGAFTFLFVNGLTKLGRSQDQTTAQLELQNKLLDHLRTELGTDLIDGALEKRYK